MWGILCSPGLQSRDQLLQLFDTRLLRFVEYAFPDALTMLTIDQATVRQNLEVLTGGWLANGKLFRYQ
jgi:hypothetical protein